MVNYEICIIITIFILSLWRTYLLSKFYIDHEYDFQQKSGEHGSQTPKQTKKYFLKWKRRYFSISLFHQRLLPKTLYISIYKFCSKFCNLLIEIFQTKLITPPPNFMLLFFFLILFLLAHHLLREKHFVLVCAYTYSSNIIYSMKLHVKQWKTNHAPEIIHIPSH